MRIISSALLLIASFGVFADCQQAWDAMGNPIWVCTGYPR